MVLLARSADDGRTVGHGRCESVSAVGAGMSWRYVSRERLFWVVVTCMLCDRLLALWLAVVYIVSHVLQACQWPCEGRAKCSAG